MSIQLSMARQIQQAESSSIVTIFDNCEIAQMALNELSLGIDAFGLGLAMRRIVDDKRMSFVKTIDPIITRRLQSAFYRRTKFRKMSFTIQEGTMAYNLRLEDTRVTGMKQKLESGIVSDIVSIESNYVELG